MKPIISPEFIYLLSVVDNLVIAFIVGAVCFGLGAYGFLFYGAIDSDREIRKRGWRLLPAAAVLSLFAVFTPSSKTLIAMEAAKLITEDNVVKAISAGKQLKEVLKQDVIDIIDAIRGEQEKGKP